MQPAHILAFGLGTLCGAIAVAVLGRIMVGGLARELQCSVREEERQCLRADAAQRQLFEAQKHLIDTPAAT